MSKSKKEFEKLIEQIKEDYDLDTVIVAGTANNAEDRMCGMLGVGNELIATIGLIIFQLAQATNTTPTKLSKRIANTIADADKEMTKDIKNNKELKDLLEEVFENED